MGGSGILTKNEPSGSALAVVALTDVYGGLQTEAQEVVLSPLNRGVVNLATPYKTFTGGANSYDGDAATVHLPQLPWDSPLLIDCAGASHITVYALLPYALVNVEYSGYKNSETFALNIAGYVPTDASKTTYTVTQCLDRYDDELFMGLYLSDAEDFENGFVSLRMAGVTFVSSPPITIPTLGFEKMQVFLKPGNYTVGATYTGIVKLYVAVT